MELSDVGSAVPIPAAWSSEPATEIFRFFVSLATTPALDETGLLPICPTAWSRTGVATDMPVECGQLPVICEYNGM